MISDRDVSVERRERTPGLCAGPSVIQACIDFRMIEKIEKQAGKRETQRVPGLGAGPSVIQARI